MTNDDKTICLSGEGIRVSIPSDALALEPLIRALRCSEALDEDYTIETVIDNDVARPAVSIVTRTQGRRPWGLRDVFSGLDCQTDQDYELVIVGHELNDEAFSLVTSLIAEAPERVKTRTRFVTVCGGGRSRPLNAGFKVARGHHIAILDDDDMVYEHYIESFRSGIESHPGAILYGHVLTQTWRIQDTPEQHATPIEQASTLYCAEPDPIEQLSVNHLPPMGLAFPSYVFHDLGVRFDESLSVLEDWDFLTRASFLCGITVLDAPPISLYRLWENTESSHTLHDEEFWKRCRSTIQDKLARMPLVFPPGTSDLFIPDRKAAFTQNAIASDNIKLYYDNCMDYAESQTLTPSRVSIDRLTGRGTYEFDNVSKLGRQKALRIDPSINGFVTLEEPMVQATSESGEARSADINAIRHSGTRVNDRTLVFLESDPKLELLFDEPIKLKKLIVSFTFHKNVSDENIAAAIEVRARQIAQSKESKPDKDADGSKGFRLIPSIRKRSK